MFLSGAFFTAIGFNDIGLYLLLPILALLVEQLARVSPSNQLTGCRRLLVGGKQAIGVHEGG